MGIDFKEADIEEIADKTDILFIFGHYLCHHFSLEEISAAFDKIETKILLTSSLNGLNSLVNLVFPTALIAEKSGSLTNVEGRVQSFSPALKPEGESLPEWQLLISLAKELKIDFEYYNQFSTSSAIFEELRKEIPFFKEKND